MTDEQEAAAERRLARHHVRGRAALLSAPFAVIGIPLALLADGTAHTVGLVFLLGSSVVLLVGHAAAALLHPTHGR